MPTNSNEVSAALLATLAEGQREIRERGAVVSEDERWDADLIDGLRSATREFEDRTNKRFQPLPESRYFDVLPIDEGGDIDGYDLVLDQELYELTTLTNGDGNTITSVSYTLLPKSGPPYNRIRLNVIGPLYWTIPPSTGDPTEAVKVDGVWVGGKAYSGQWFTGVDTLIASVGVGAQLITLDWTEDLDPFLRKPRFSPGQLLRWSKSGAVEYLAVLKADFANSQLTVRRGERGTTPISPDDDTPIDVWRVDERVQMAVALEGGYRFARRGNFQLSTYNPNTGVTERFATGNTQRFEQTIADYSKNAVVGPKIRAV